MFFFIGWKWAGESLVLLGPNSDFYGLYAGIGSLGCLLLFLKLLFFFCVLSFVGILQ